MRNFTFLLLSLFIITATACSSDDDNSSSSNNILGRWIPTEMHMEGSMTEDGMTMEFVGTATQFHQDSHVTFLEDHTYVSYQGPFEMEVSISFMGQTITETLPGEDYFDEEGEWEKRGNTLVVTSPDGESFSYNIIKLNSTTLKIGATVNEGMGIGLPMNTDFNVTMTFRR